VVTLDHFDATRHDCRYVLPDTQTGVHRLLDHLLEQGATSIAAIFVDADWSPLSESLTAYEAWMASRGLTPRLAPVGIQSAAAFGEVTRRTYVVARDLLSGGGRPDAVIALFGGFAIEVLRAARDLNLRCPEDLLVAQDIDGARERSIDRGVTAIDLRPDLQAEAAVGMLLDILDGREPPTHHVTPVDLNVRSTTLRRR
jgi:DNA-binding LacI/PurR family transcriptional regulator